MDRCLVALVVHASAINTIILPESAKIQPWQACRISIRTDPPLDVQVDGEMRGHTPINVEVVPAVVSVLTLG